MKENAVILFVLYITLMLVCAVRYSPPEPVIESPLNLEPLGKGYYEMRDYQLPDPETPSKPSPPNAESSPFWDVLAFAGGTAWCFFMIWVFLCLAKGAEDMKKKPPYPISKDESESQD